MPEPHVFDANAMEWSRDPRFPKIAIKILESKLTHPTTSVVLVRLEPGADIQTHVHEVASETAYILDGEGTFTVDGERIVQTAGMGLTVPPGTPHSLVNTGSGALELIAMHSPPTR